MPTPRCSAMAAANRKPSPTGNSMYSIQDRVASATWKIDAMQTAARARQNPNPQAHRVQRVTMARMARETMK